MSIIDDVIAALEKAAQIATSGGTIGGGIIPVLAVQDDERPRVFEALKKVHDSLGVQANLPAVNPTKRVTVSVQID